MSKDKFDPEGSGYDYDTAKAHGMGPGRQMSETKVKLHKELNEAYAKLSRICLLLDLPTCHGTLLRRKSFMSKMVDNSNFKSV